MLRDTTPKYDAVVLLCGGVHRSRKFGHWGLNFESSFKAKAAAVVYQKGKTPVIISSGGPMWGAPPLGRLMADYLSSDRLNHKFYIPPEAIVQENDSTDTGEQIKNIMEIVNVGGFRNIGVIGDSEHLKVAVPVFQSYGLAVEGLPMENILVQKEPRYQKVINRLHSSPYWRWWKFKYGRLQKRLAQDPRLESPVLNTIARFQRTKLPWLRLPGTT